MDGTLRVSPKTLLSGVLVLLGAVAVRTGVVEVRAQTPASPAGAAIVPYTVVLTESVTGASGQTKAAPSQTWALRSDGATALKIGDGAQSTRHIRFPDGTNFEVSDALRLKRRGPTGTEGRRLRDPRQYCAAPAARESNGPSEGAPTLEALNGYRAAKIIRGDGTYWYAVDVGCALIKRVMSFGANGGTSALELVSLIPGEPSEALFLVPAEYREQRR